MNEYTLIFNELLIHFVAWSAAVIVIYHAPKGGSKRFLNLLISISSHAGYLFHLAIIYMYKVNWWCFARSALSLWSRFLHFFVHSDGCFWHRIRFWNWHEKWLFLFHFRINKRKLIWKTKNDMKKSTTHNIQAEDKEAHNWNYVIFNSSKKNASFHFSLQSKQQYLEVMPNI